MITMNVHITRLIPVFAAALSLVATSIFAADTASKPLLDLTTAEVDPHLTPKCQQVSVSRSTDANAPGIVVTIQPGKEAYPGVILKPEPATWDLSAFGHVEARVANLGTVPMTVVLQVDNAGDWHNAPWNAEPTSIKPGATVTLSVIFGYSYGHRRGYSLKPSEISRVLVFAGKSDGVLRFRIESISAAGPAGEKPPIDPNSIRTWPQGGIILGAGAGAALNPAKQIEAKRGAQAELDGAGLKIQFPTGKGEQSVSLKPAIGRWDLGKATEVRVKVKNAGKTSITPAVQVTSEKVNATIAASVALAPDASLEIMVPFAPAIPWKGTPSAGIWKGALSGEKTGTPDVQPGTGTKYASDKTDAIKITATHEGDATLLIESIIADAPVAERPDWLGTRPPVDGDWVKTFDDEFNQTAVDLSKWNNEGPNYWDKLSHWSKNNIILDGQAAHLRYEKKTGYHNDDPKQKQTDFAGGYLDTLGKWRQRYGYFEARVKLPTAPGLWPAFWMMPDRGESTPDAPGSKKNRCTTSNGGMEFDIMEQLTIWGPHRYNVAMHWDDYGPAHKSIGTGKIYFQPDREGFVTTGLLWAPGLAVYYCNGKEAARWEDPRISNVPAYMIVYMPTGGWDNNILDGTGLPDDLVVDYVRCWQRKDLAVPTDAEPPPSAALRR